MHNALEDQIRNLRYFSVQNMFSSLDYLCNKVQLHHDLVSSSDFLLLPPPPPSSSSRILLHQPEN